MASSIDNISILIVENEDPMGDLIETVLNTVDTRQIYKARNGEHGHVLFQAINHDLIIVDLDIEPEGALEFVGKIRDPQGSFTNKEVPVLLMATFMQGEVLDQARAMGIDDLLVKPFSFDDLVKKVNFIMDNKSEPKTKDASYG